MKNAVKLIALCALLIVVANSRHALAQRPRTVGDQTSASTTSSAATRPAPQSVRAKYEGGVFGYNKRVDGTLTFDDASRRLVFRDKVQKEILSIPYDSVAGAFADNQSRRPAAATVASNIPFYGFPASFIRKKVRYLTIQYSDADTKVNGVTSFRLDNKEILASMLNTLAAKANLTQRGEVFIRKEPASTMITTTTIMTSESAPRPTPIPTPTPLPPQS
ncbi:MAG: hypothetical protein ACR2LC_09115 [Pyrinomonadaceae bacterium]